MRFIGFFLLMSTVFTIAMTNNHFLRREDTGITHLQKMTLGSSSSSGKLSNGSTILCWICSPILFIMSFVIIWNNERKAAIDHRRISLIKSIIIQVNPYNIRQVQGADGKLVHACGDIKSNQAITDTETGLRINGVVKIKRQVEVRQMRQHNGRYQPVWVSNPQQQSVAGGPANDPAAWFLRNGCTYGPNVYLGNYLVSQSLKQQLICSSPYTPTMQDALIISNKLRVRSKPIVDGDFIYFPSSPGSFDSLGTLRVKFWICKTGPVSVISQSFRNTFTAFQIDVYENGQQDGSISQSNKCACCFLSNCTADMLTPINKIDIISEQHLTSDQMIQNEKKKIDCSKNSIRVLSYAIMVFSICGFFFPITSLIGYVPLLGSLLSGALGLAIFIAASLVCIPLFLLAVGIAWLVFHPKTGLIILGIGLTIGGVLLAIMLGNKRKNTFETAQMARHTIFSLRSFVKK